MSTEPRSTRLEERSPVQIGALVAGKYRVEKLIAAGGMGVIVAARHETLGQQVAIKVLAPDADYVQQAERFLREARAAAAIESSHVCRVFDCGTLESGVPYMVMERLVGHDLGHELRARGPLPVGEAVDMVLEALEGIGEAHALGIIHRDLKPSNLFMSQRPGRAREIKVLDFGISKLTPIFEASVEEDLTHTEMMLGSPRYMSPEQVQNARAVDARTDIWSIGVILYQLLDGRSPFHGTTMGETIGKVLTHDAPPIKKRRKDVPEGLATVLDRCLMRDREKRYRNVAELALALAPFGTGAAQASVQRVTALLIGGQLGAAADVAVPPPSSPVAVEPREERSLGTVSAFSHSSRSDNKSRRLGRWIAAMLALASIAAAVVVWKLGTSSEPSVTPEVAPAGVAAPTPAPTSKPEPSPPAAATPAAPAPTLAERTADAGRAAEARRPAAVRPKPPVKRTNKSPDDILSESY